MEEKSNASGNTAVKASEGNSISLKKATVSKAKTATKSTKMKKSHPPVSQMVIVAIKELQDRKGSSLRAIKKYILSSYDVDAEKMTPFIKRYLKLAVKSGELVQFSGKGASGSFKLAGVKSAESKAKPERPAKVASPKKQKKSVEKTTQARKPVEKKKASPAKKSQPVKKATLPVKKTPEKVEKPAAKPKASPGVKTISKSKKTAKAPAAKTKTPKPKNVGAQKAKVAAKK